MKPIYVIFLFSTSAFAQPNVVYTSLEEALKNKEQVYQLDITGATRSPFSESICELTNLRVLNLSFKSLDTLPECIGDLINLEELNLWSNQLRALPESMEKLVNLKKLIIGFNPLGIFPEVLTRMPNLESLEMPHAFLDSLPNSINRMTNLRSLNLKFNRFKKFPIELTTLPNLAYLDLSYNRLTTIPGYVAEMKKLRTLILKKNEIESISDSLVLLPSIRTLDLSENWLMLLPASMACWKQPELVQLEANRMTDFHYFSIISDKADENQQMFFGTTWHMSQPGCDCLDPLFDSLGVISIQDALEIADSVKLKIGGATLFINQKDSTSYWKIVTTYEYGKTGNRRDSYLVLRSFIYINAITGEITEVKKEEERWYYGPSEY